MPEKVKHNHHHISRGSHRGMQLVLTEDVKHLGQQGDLVEVRSGYGRNYLLPRGMATLPTAHNLRLLERYKVRVNQAREARVADLRVLAEQIQRVPHLTIEANANEEGHLYGSVTGHDIAKSLKGKNLKVEPDMVKMEGPIKLCGLYELQLHLGHDIETTIKVMVVRQMQSEKK